MSVVYIAFVVVDDDDDDDDKNVMLCLYSFQFISSKSAYKNVRGFFYINIEKKENISEVKL
jgi:hypothetical protein